MTVAAMRVTGMIVPRLVVRVIVQVTHAHGPFGSP
ncbi:hypothetical protein BH11MYX3_BH11MYX3_28210 [soil metagenome]